MIWHLNAASNYMGMGHTQKRKIFGTDCDIMINHVIIIYNEIDFKVVFVCRTLDTDGNVVSSDIIIYIYPQATFPDFHSVRWCNWCYKSRMLNVESKMLNVKWQMSVRLNLLAERTFGVSPVILIFNGKVVLIGAFITSTIDIIWAIFCISRPKISTDSGEISTNALLGKAH